MASGKFARARWLDVSFVIVFCLPGTPARAQQLTTQAQSLKWIPAEAGAYSTMLRNREQIDPILQGNAWARLLKMPAAKLGLQALDMEKKKPGPFADIHAWYQQPANAKLIDLLLELGSEEV